jgi:REP element-mobilizing transposase RayT
MPHFHKSSGHSKVRFRDQHRFEHWYRDNSVYFITSSTRDHFPCFESEEAKAVFWDRFLFHAHAHGFEPWIVSLMSNHYHVIGYMKQAQSIGEMMRKIHGSVAKLTNDVLPERRKPFWRERGGRDYFDGCLRDVNQLCRAYGYTERQSVRHGLCGEPKEYPHTRVWISLDDAVKFAIDRKCLMEGVPYARYARKGKNRSPSH